MVLSSSVFVQPFIVFPSHILLQFQAYHQFSSLHPISIPGPHLIFLSFENLFQIPPVSLRKNNFLSSFMPFIHTFLFPPPTQLGVIPSLSEVPTIFPPSSAGSPPYFDVPEGDNVWSTSHKGCLLSVQVCGLSPSPTLAQR